MAFLTPDDLSAFTETAISETKALTMIEDATALATLAAPCLAVEADLTATQTAQVRAVLRGAILRWVDAGSGALQSQQAGPFGQTLDTRQPRKGMFWPSEIQQLQNICGGSDSTGIYGVDTVGSTTVHSDICATNFGAIYCSCGADIAGYPLYEVT